MYLQFKAFYLQKPMRKRMFILFLFFFQKKNVFKFLENIILKPTYGTYFLRKYKKHSKGVPVMAQWKGI